MKRKTPRSCTAAADARETAGVEQNSGRGGRNRTHHGLIWSQTRQPWNMRPYLKAVCRSLRIRRLTRCQANAPNVYPIATKVVPDLGCDPPPLSQVIYVTRSRNATLNSFLAQNQ